MESRFCSHPFCDESSVIHCKECSSDVCRLHGCQRCGKCHECTKLAKSVHYFCIPCRKEIGCIYKSCDHILRRFCSACGDNVCKKHCCPACGRCKECTEKHKGRKQCPECFAGVYCELVSEDESGEECPNRAIQRCSYCDSPICSSHTCGNCGLCDNCCECKTCSFSECGEHSDDNCNDCNDPVCEKHTCDHCDLCLDCCECQKCSRCGHKHHQNELAYGLCTSCRNKLGCIYNCGHSFRRKCTNCADHVCSNHSCDACGRCDECIFNRRGQTCDSCWNKQPCIYKACGNKATARCYKCNDAICQNHTCSECRKCLDCCRCDRCSECGKVNPDRCYCGRCLNCYWSTAGVCTYCDDDD